MSFGLIGNRKFRSCAKTMFWHLIPHTIKKRFSVTAVSYSGKQKGRAAGPDSRISLPDMFLSTGILHGNQLSAEGVDGSGCFGIVDSNNHVYSPFHFIFLIHIGQQSAKHLLAVFGQQQDHSSLDWQYNRGG